MAEEDVEHPEQTDDGVKPSSPSTQRRSCCAHYL
jgi:hypothetical protein